MKTETNKETFYGVSDQKGDVFFCPMNGADEISPDINECIGADVLERYSGNLEIVHDPRK